MKNDYWEIMEIKNSEFSLGVLNLMTLTLNVLPLTVGYKNNEITSFRDIGPKLYIEHIGDERY